MSPVLVPGSRRRNCYVLVLLCVDNRSLGVPRRLPLRVGPMLPPQPGRCHITRIAAARDGIAGNHRTFETARAGPREAAGGDRLLIRAWRARPRPASDGGV